jgi:SPP1 gp7 family putative phage head morphogenesis protein
MTILQHDGLLVNANPNHDDKGKFTSSLRGIIKRPTKSPEVIKQEQISSGERAPDHLELPEHGWSPLVTKAKDASGTEVLHVSVYHPNTRARIGVGEFKSLEGNKLYPNSIHVHQAFRRQGIASSIYDKLKELGYQVVEQKGRTTEGEKFRKAYDKRPITNALPGSPSRLKTFRSWLRKQMDVDLVGDEVIEEYIRRAYIQGAKRARHSSTRRSSAEVQRGKDAEFSRSFLQGPGAVASVKLLASRTYSELEGITARMATKINAILIDGMLTGKSNEEMTGLMVDAVDIEYSRAKAIVDTELVRAQAVGQLESFAHHGVTQVEADVEWEAGINACPKCTAMAGRIFTIAEAMGLIPLHVHCKCNWVKARSRK